MKIHGTGKGGALSKKDFGVAFGTGAVSTDFWVEDVGDWVNDGGQTTKESPTSSYVSYNTTVVSSPPQTAIISILNFDSYYFTEFVSAAYLASSGGQSPPIDYDERSCEFGFLCRADSGGDAKKIRALVDGGYEGGYSDDQMTTSSKIKMVITSTSFAITYSVDGTFTDTVNFFSTTFSSDTTQRMLATNNNGLTTSNSITAEFS